MEFSSSTCVCVCVCACVCVMHVNVCLYQHKDIHLIKFYSVADEKKPIASISASLSSAATTTTASPSQTTPPSPPPSSLTPSSEATEIGAELTSDSKAEIEADGNMVRELRDLVSNYSLMLTKFRRLLAGCDISEARFFLNNLFNTDIFTSCDNIEQLLNQLCHRYVDIFNVYYLQKIATCL